MNDQTYSCPECGQLNTTRRTTCKACGINFKEVEEELEIKSLEERKEILSESLIFYLHDGWRVYASHGESVWLIRQKKFRWLLFFMFPIYLFYYILFRYDKKHITVTETGQIQS